MSSHEANNRPQTVEKFALKLHIAKNRGKGRGDRPKLLRKHLYFSNLLTPYVISGRRTKCIRCRSKCKRSTTDASLRAIAENLRGVSEAGQRRSAGIFQGSSLS